MSGPPLTSGRVSECNATETINFVQMSSGVKANDINGIDMTGAGGGGGGEDGRGDDMTGRTAANRETGKNYWKTRNNLSVHRREYRRISIQCFVVSI